MDVRIRRLLVAFGAEQLLEPRVAKPAERIRRHIRRGNEHTLELAQRDRLLLLVPRNRIRLAADVGLELLACLEKGAPVRVEHGRCRSLELAELFALGVWVEDCEPRLGRAQW